MKFRRSLRHSSDSQMPIPEAQAAEPAAPMTPSDPSDLSAAPGNPASSSAASPTADLEVLAAEAAARSASWADGQEKKLLKRCGEKLVRRCNFIYELVSTEISHLRNLNVLQAVFREPLRRLPASAAVTPAEIEALFPQLDLLERLHAALLADLRRCEPPAVLAKSALPPSPEWAALAGVGAALRRHLSGPAAADWLAAYGGFCSEHTVTLQSGLAGLTARSAGFAAALKDCERSPQAGRKTLLDHYLTVTQRLAKYKTLLPQIAECSQSAPQDPDMLAACADLDALLKAVNDQVEQRHNEHLLSQVAANFQPEQGVTVQQHLAGRRLVHSGRLQVRLQEAKSAAAPCFGLLLHDSLLLLQELPGGRFAPLAGPAIAGCRCLPLMRFAETDAIVRETDGVGGGGGGGGGGGSGGGNGSTFFIVVKRPDPKLISVTCHSLEDRGKWLQRINQVRDSNPRADERAQEAARQLRQKSAASADLLASMERRDRAVLTLLNEKDQLYHQLLLLWGCQKQQERQQQQQQLEDSLSSLAAAVSPESQPERLCREALAELGRLRRLVRSRQELSGSQEDPSDATEADADSASLKRSSSSAEEKSTSATAAAAAVSLPKRADTFSGYDASMNRRPTVSKRLVGLATGMASAAAQVTETGGVALREKDKEPKSRRSSMFEKFRRPREQQQPAPPPQPVLTEDPADCVGLTAVATEMASPTTPTPDVEGLEAIGRLQALVSAMTAALLSERSRLADGVQREAELREEVLGLRSSREQEAFRSQDSILEMIRLQRSELDRDRAKFREERLRESARMETRREDADRREELLRERQQELELEAGRLEEQRRLLALQAEQLQRRARETEELQSGGGGGGSEKSLKARAAAAGLRNGETAVRQ